MPRRPARVDRGGEKRPGRFDAPRSYGRFIVEKLDARRLHFDFRLELDGVLKSWAVMRGPSLDPADKRLAVRTADHRLGDADGERDLTGASPEGGEGPWDVGTWSPRGDPHADLDKGLLAFELEGSRLKGGFALVRLGRKARENWLLIKERDAYARENDEEADRWLSSGFAGRALDVLTREGSEAPRKPATRRGRRRTPRERPEIRAGKGERRQPKGDELS